MAISRILNNRLATMGSPTLNTRNLNLLQQALASSRLQPKAPTLSAKTPTLSAKTPAPQTRFSTSKTTANRLAQATGNQSLTNLQNRSNATNMTSGLASAPTSFSNTGSGGTGAAQLQAQANAAAAATGGNATGGVSDPTGTGTSKFAQSFTPDSFQMMFQNPEALIRAYYDFMKYDTGGGELAMSQGQNAENLLLMNTLFGSGRDMEKSLNGNQFGPYADFAGGYLENARTPGGDYYSADQILAALGNQDPSSTIHQNLYAEGLTPDQQAGNYIYAYSTAAAPTTSREALSAQVAYLSTLEQKFMAEKAQGKHAGLNFGEYLKANGWG